MLTTSVAVVRKMLDAVAGSAPNLCSVSGTSAPEMPLITQLPIIASQVITASFQALGILLHASHRRACRARR